MSIEEDAPRLARGLEQGLGQVGFISAIPEQLRLRTSCCGLASIALSQYLTDTDVDHELVISRPRLPVDPTLEHVFIRTAEAEPRIIDATYSQFLGYVGLTHAYVSHGGLDEFPTDKIAIVSERQSRALAETLASTALHFVQTRSHPVNRYGIEYGYGPLDRTGRRGLIKQFSKIWDPKNLDYYCPSGEMLEASEIVSRELAEPSLR